MRTMRTITTRIFAAIFAVALLASFQLPAFSQDDEYTIEIESLVPGTEDSEASASSKKSGQIAEIDLAKIDRSLTSVGGDQARNGGRVDLDTTTATDNAFYGKNLTEKEGVVAILSWGKRLFRKEDARASAIEEVTGSVGDNEKHRGATIKMAGASMVGALEMLGAGNIEGAREAIFGAVLGMVAAKKIPTVGGAVVAGPEVNYVNLAVFLVVASIVIFVLCRLVMSFKRKYHAWRARKAQSDDTDTPDPADDPRAKTNLENQVAQLKGQLEKERGDEGVTVP